MHRNLKLRLMCSLSLLLILFVSNISCVGNKKLCKESVQIIDFGATPKESFDNSKSIQKAIDYAVEQNVPLWVNKGKFLIYSPLVLKSNLEIIGQDGAEIIQKNGKCPVFEGRNLESISLQNLKITGVGQYSSSWTNSGSRKSRGIDLENCQNIKIVECEISNHGLSGIYIAGGQNITVRGNFIEGTHLLGAKLNQKDNYQFGIAVVAASPPSILKDILVEQNEIRYVNQGIITSQGGKNHSLNIQIQGNKISDIIGQHGIYCSTSNTIIVNNSIQRVGLEGIKIQAAKSSLENFVLEKNTVFDAPNSQAYNFTELNEGKHFIRNIVMTDCSAVNVARGLNISGKIVDAKISNFKIKNLTTQHGIFIQSTKGRNIKFKNITIENPKQYGILINSKSIENISFDDITINSQKSYKRAVYIIEGDNIKFTNIKVQGDPISKNELQVNQNSRNIKLNKKLVSKEEIK